MREIIRAIVVYKGDITEKLKACGIRRPSRLNAEGNTEQEIDCFRGYKAPDLIRLARDLKPLILDECRKNGPVKNLRWVIMQSSSN